MVNPDHTFSLAMQYANHSTLFRRLGIISEAADLIEYASQKNL